MSQEPYDDIETPEEAEAMLRADCERQVARYRDFHRLRREAKERGDRETAQTFRSAMWDMLREARRGR